MKLARASIVIPTLGAIILLAALVVERGPFVAERLVIDRGTVVQQICHYVTWRGILDIRVDPSVGCAGSPPRFQADTNPDAPNSIPRAAAFADQRERRPEHRMRISEDRLLGGGIHALAAFEHLDHGLS